MQQIDQAVNDTVNPIRKIWEHPCKLFQVILLKGNINKYGAIIPYHIQKGLGKGTYGRIAAHVEALEDAMLKGHSPKRKGIGFYGGISFAMKLHRYIFYMCE